MKLYGTTTSPYTRKVRMLCEAIGLPVELVDTRTEAGKAQHTLLAPLGKWPVLDTGNGVLPDSGLICAWLWAHHGAALAAAGFNLSSDDWGARSLQVVVEGALEAAVNRFYLRRDGFEDKAYVARQGERVEAALGWLDTRITFGRPLGHVGLSLGCALDWMVFRGVVDLGRMPGLSAFRQAWTASEVGKGTEPRE